MKSKTSDIDIGDKFVRLGGDKREVTVFSLTVDGFVGLHDGNGMHFVPIQTLMDETYFKRLKPDDTNRQKV